MTPTNLIVPIAVAALAFLTWVLFRLVRMTWRGDTPAATRLATRVFVLWVIALPLATLGGRPQDARGTIYFNWVPFATQRVESELAVNLLLFTPAGFLLPWLARHTTRHRLILLAFAGGAVLSSAIEVFQTFTTLGTAGDLTDILLNTTGCTAAAIVATIAHQLLVSHHRTRSAELDSSSTATGIRTRNTH